MVVTTVTPGGEPDGVYLRAPVGVHIPDDGAWTLRVARQGTHDTIQITRGYDNCGDQYDAVTKYTSERD